jgi:hypothetical protein
MSNWILNRRGLGFGGRGGVEQQSEAVEEHGCSASSGAWRQGRRRRAAD